MGQPKPTSHSAAKRRGIGSCAVPAPTKRPRLTDEEEARNDLAELKALGFKVAGPLAAEEIQTSQSSDVFVAAAAAFDSGPPSSQPDEAWTEELQVELSALEGLLELDDMGLKVSWPAGHNRATSRIRAEHLATLQPPRADASMAA